MAKTNNCGSIMIPETLSDIYRQQERLIDDYEFGILSCKDYQEKWQTLIVKEKRLKAKVKSNEKRKNK